MSQKISLGMWFYPSERNTRYQWCLKRLLCGPCKEGMFPHCLHLGSKFLCWHWWGIPWERFLGKHITLLLLDLDPAWWNTVHCVSSERSTQERAGLGFPELASRDQCGGETMERQMFCLLRSKESACICKGIDISWCIGSSQSRNTFVLMICHSRLSPSLLFF